MEMSSAGGYFDLIFFALLAGAIFYKLFTVLGRKDDGTPPPPAEIPKKDDASSPDLQTNESWPLGMTAKKPAAPVLQARQPRRDPEPEIADKALAATLNDIRTRDPQFSAGSFLAGAKTAFEMVLKALQDGDKTTLKNLLSAEVYKDFASELDRREKEGKFPQTTLVAIRKADITEASFNKHKATVSVDFTTEQIHVVRDKERAIIEGDASAVITLTDGWTFERDLRSGNPNWTVIAT